MKFGSLAISGVLHAAIYMLFALGADRVERRMPGAQPAIALQFFVEIAAESESAPPPVQVPEPQLQPIQRSTPATSAPVTPTMSAPKSPTTSAHVTPMPATVPPPPSLIENQPKHEADANVPAEPAPLAALENVRQEPPAVTAAPGSPNAPAVPVAPAAIAVPAAPTAPAHPLARSAQTTPVRPTAPAIIGPLAPHYPRLAQRRGLEGTVILDVRVGLNGEVLAIAFVERSGHKLLDDEAERCVRDCKFTPARQGNAPIIGHLEIPIVFRLQ